MPKIDFLDPKIERKSGEIKLDPIPVNQYRKPKFKFKFRMTILLCNGEMFRSSFAYATRTVLRTG